MIFGPRTVGSDSKVRAKRLKYVTFCNEVGALPLLPTKPANLLRFALWLPANGIRSGYRSLFYDDGPVSCAVLTMHTAAYDGQGPS